MYAMKTNRGFTLIELLVVIAVIAFLMGILMPALRMAREQARSVVCASNLKTMGLGWRLYADENNGKIVFGFPGTTTQFMVDPKRHPWVVVPDSVSNATLEERIEGIKQGALWPYIKSEQVYRCPSDRRKNVANLGLAFRTWSIPHGLNCPPGGPWGEIKEECKNLTDIRNPSRKYVFVPESDPGGINFGSWILQPVSGEWIDPFGAWHRGRSTNFVFADGYVGKRSWQSQELVDWCTDSIDNPGRFIKRRLINKEDPGEISDWAWAVNGWAYKQLTGPIQTFGPMICMISEQLWPLFAR